MTINNTTKDHWHLWCLYRQVRWWWSSNTASMGTCPTSYEPRESSFSHTGYQKRSSFYFFVSVWSAVMNPQRGSCLLQLANISLLCFRYWTTSAGSINLWQVFHILFFFFFCFFVSIDFGGDALNCFLTQDRSPKTQSQVRRMIEAGQMDQRARHPPSPSSSPLTSPQSPSTNMSNQSPVVEKSETIRYLTRRRVVSFLLLLCVLMAVLCFSSLQWKTCGKLLWQ